MEVDLAQHGKMQKVLLTGHLGYVGTVAASVLAAAGIQVTGCDINLFNKADFPPAGNLPPVHNIGKDIRDLTPADLEGFDGVVHLAALSNDLLGQLRLGPTQDIDHLGTIHVAKCAKAAGLKRFVFA